MIDEAEAGEVEKAPDVCVLCGAVEEQGRLWHKKGCQRIFERPPATDEERPKRGILLNMAELAEIRGNARRWMAGDTKALGDYIRESGLMVLQVLPKVALGAGGHRSSNQQRVAAAKAFVQLSGELVKVMDALEARAERTHRRPAALRAQEAAEEAARAASGSPQSVLVPRETVDDADSKLLN